MKVKNSKGKGVVNFIKINKHYPPLRSEKLDDNPFVEFSNWFSDAEKKLPENLVNAMTLVTVDATNKPSARIVLLKHFSEDGFIFFTNLSSKKAQDIEKNPNVSILFWWEGLDRQIRIEGQAEKVSEELADAYFQTRHRSSQIAALVSPQSSIIEDFQILTNQYEQLLQKYSDETSKILRPSNWGGFLIKATQFEFWQGGAFRLHDRVRYHLKNSQWVIQRLAP